MVTLIDYEQIKKKASPNELWPDRNAYQLCSVSSAPIKWISELRDELRSVDARLELKRGNYYILLPPKRRESDSFLEAIGRSDMLEASIKGLWR